MVPRGVVTALGVAIEVAGTALEASGKLVVTALEVVESGWLTLGIAEEEELICRP